MTEAVRQLRRPMIEGVAHGRQAPMEWLDEVRRAALGQLFERGAKRLAGPSGGHRSERSYFRWGLEPGRACL